VVYDPKAFFPHAASLRQAFAHCGKFLTAASRRSLGRLSVPVWLVALSNQLPIGALVSHYLTNKLIGRGPVHERIAPFNVARCLATFYAVLANLSASYPPLAGRLTTCYSPVCH
jgi:hypothetical protein